MRNNSKINHFIKRSNFIVLFTILFSILLSFQNCSNNFQTSQPLEPMVIQTASIENDSVNPQLTEPEFSWKVTQQSPLQNPLIKFNEFYRLLKWYDNTNKLISLYPPLIANTKSLDIEHSPLYVNAMNGYRLYFDNKVYLSPAAQDNSSFRSDSYTVLVEFENIEFPVVNPKVVRIFSLQPANSTDTGILVLDVSELDGKIKLTATQWISATTYASNFILLEKDILSSGFGVSVRFAKTADSLSLAVNGQLTTNKPTIVGTVPNLNFIDRSIELHSSSYGSSGSFNLAEFGIYKSIMNDENLVQLSLDLYRRHVLHEIK